MASWFSGSNLGASLDTIKNQVSASLREVLEEEEPTDPAAQLAVTKSKVSVLHQTIPR